ncbi:hypothetical protein NLU13_8752 [Sarocladium strictum]|uniref:Uncharacterized protein n=1 Tax=Sarocladium strictum TaxID=5046 RepID=A0AA39GCL3_SARSR|nr:hypothetical protein NLU13_8752 [Sarocladium strictum]
MAEMTPTAVRGSRRSNIGVGQEHADTSPEITTARTPRRGTKRVRFSDPGPALLHDGSVSASASSGLTPMVRRTSLSNHKRRRVSAPIRPFLGPGSATGQASLCQAPDAIVDGRVQRRLRRSNVRDIVNKLDLEKKRSSSELKALRNELRARDQEIYELQNATIIVDNERIWDLERQVADLQREVERRTRDDDTELNDDRSLNWTLAARDPFEDDFMDLGDDAEDSRFGNATIGQFVCSTPSKARSSFPTSSFPTPPATSPTAPATPTARFVLPPPTPSSHAGVQVSLEDAEKVQLQEELASLRLEMSKLTGTLGSYQSLAGKLEEQLSHADHNGSADVTDPLDTLEGRVAELLRAASDRRAALQQLTESIEQLGFPGSDADAMVASLATHFRAARLELEYLTPGEITLPLTSHGAEVLDLLLTRLRELATRVKEGEDSIDEYHEIELSLRKQLDARVSVMDALKAEMGKAQKLMMDRDTRIHELEVGNSRLKGAVSGYVRDISELEKLVESLEQQSNDAAATHTAKEESSRRSISSKDDVIEELEVKLSAAARRAESLQQQLTDASATHSRQIGALNRQHGKALALRDARVAELRLEIDRVNESIRAAHETIRGLRVEKGGMQTKMEEERRRAKAALDAMKEELQRVLQMSQDFLDTPRKDGSVSGVTSTAEPRSASPIATGGKIAAGSLLAGELARRGSKKLRRRHDSGLGLMDDEEVEACAE